jgi:hypothetical protein
MTHDGFRTALQERRTSTTVLVVVGLLMSACTSSTQEGSSSTLSSSPVDATNTPSAAQMGLGLPQVHFAGFPPVGAHASKPATGKLVLSFQERGTKGFAEVDLNVYADGRMIWQNWTHSNQAAVVPRGSKQFDTGFVVQRLTPQGIELLRSKIVSTGLFDRDLALGSKFPPSSLQITALNGGRLVSLDASTPGWCCRPEKLRKETPTQERALWRLKVILADPAAWLPPTAWADSKIRAFVPSRYFVAYDRSAPDASMLPSPLRELLLQYNELFQNGCQQLTTDQARVLLDALVAAGKSPSTDPQWIEFNLPGPPRGTPSDLHFSPELPDSYGPTGC